MKYVACYARVSTDEQKKFGFSIQAQKDALEKYCKENNYKYEFYIDEGISASSMKRPALQKMLSKVSVFDMILFTKLDRLSRNVLDANNINKILKDNNCTMKAIDEDDIDTSTADGTFIFNLKVSLAQREIGKTSERINFVFQNKREKGEVTSGTSKYGYSIVNKHFVINQKEAENIRDFYNFYINNAGDTQITFNYFKDHFPSPGYDTYKRILSDTAYIGKYKLYRKNIYLDNYIPAIIDEKTFYLVQDLLKKKRRISKNSKNPPLTLFDGIIRCSKCGGLLSRHIAYREYGTYISYRCWKSNRFSSKKGEQFRCTNKTSVSESKIEKMLLESFRQQAQKKIAENTVESKPVKNTFVDNSPAIRKKLEKLKDLYIDDLIDKEDYKKDYKRLTNELEKIEKEKLKFSSPKPKDLSKVQQLLKLNYEEIYNTLSPLEKRNLWLSVIDSFYFDGEKIERIVFK